jgi:hypothetical protein
LYGIDLKVEFYAIGSASYVDAATVTGIGAVRTV